MAARDHTGFESLELNDSPMINRFGLFRTVLTLLDPSQPPVTDRDPRARTVLT